MQYNFVLLECMMKRLSFITYFLILYFLVFLFFLVGDGPFLKIFILGPSQNEKLNLYPQKVATFQKTYLQKVATF